MTYTFETSGEVINFGRERTKSESPEIRLSVHDVPYSEPPQMAKQTYTNTLQPMMETPSLVPTTTAKEDSTLQPIGHRPDLSDSSVQQPPPDSTNDSHPQPSMQAPPTHPIHSETKHTEIGPRWTSNNIFEIVSDTDYARDRQRMHNVKRLRSGPSVSHPDGTSDGHSGRSEYHKNKGNLLASSHSKSDQGGSDISLKNVVIFEDKGFLEAPASPQGIEAVCHEETQQTPVHRGSDLSTAASSLEGRLSPRLLRNEEGNADGGLQEARKSSSEVACGGSQEFNLPAKNWSHLDELHPLKQALSQARRPDCSALLDLGEPNASRLKPSDLGSDGESSLKKTFEEQKEQETRRAAQLRADKEAKAKQSEDKERYTPSQRVGGLKVDETNSADTKESDNAKEKQGQEQDQRHDQGQPQKQKQKQVEKEEEEAEEAEVKGKPHNKNLQISDKKPVHVVKLNLGRAIAKAVQEAEEMEQEGSGRSKGKRKVARERTSKEKVSADEAEETVSEQDSLDQLKIGDAQQQSKPAAFSSKGAAIKTPRSKRKAPANEEQNKKRRDATVAKRQTLGPLQTAESSSTKAWAESLFHSNDSSNDSCCNVDPNPANKTTVKSSGRASSKRNTTSTFRSSSPTPSKVIDRQVRRSMTPALPSPKVTKPSCVPASRTSSSPSRLSLPSETPLRSALRNQQTSSALRRSVSFVPDQRGTPAHDYESSTASSNVKSIIPAGQPYRTLVDINNELALATPAASGGNRKAAGQNQSGKTKIDTVVKKELVQKKLDVVRDKKQKGRAVEKPTPQRQISKPEISQPSINSNSKSQSMFDTEGADNHGKAGPSSRKRASDVLPRHENVNSSNLGGTLIDPAIENLGSSNSQPAPDLPPAHSNTESNTSSQQRFPSRSPAQVVPETMSVSSGPTSESQSGSGEESDQDSDNDSIEDVESPNAGPSQPSMAKTHTGTKDIGLASKPGNPGERNDESLRRMEESTDSGSNESTDDEAETQQLQVECSQPVPVPVAKTPSSSSNGSAPHDMLLNHTYPKLSTLRKLPHVTGSEKEVSTSSPSNHPINLPEEEDESSSSGSDSTRSATDDEDEVSHAKSAGVQTNSKSKSSMLRGLGGVMRRKSQGA